MSSPVVTLTQGQSLPLAGELMELTRTRHLPVLDQAGLLVGLVTHRDLLQASISSLTPLSRMDREELQLKVPVSRIMRRQVWTIGPHAPAEAAARLMFEHRIGCLPVTVGGRVVGIVTEADIVELATTLLPQVSHRDPVPLMTLSALWTPAPQVIEASQSLTIARQVMDTLDIRHLPVVIADELYGLLCERELAIAEALVQGATCRMSVGQLVKHPAFVVNPDARPEEVAIDMANGKHSAALAVRAGKVLGIITTTDLARALGLSLRAVREEQHPSLMPPGCAPAAPSHS